MIDLPPACLETLSAPIMQQIVHVESSGNPFAIGVVKGRLIRQPKTLKEAVATAEYLESLGYNFSIGKAQVNRIHFERLGWKENIAEGFDVCPNVLAGREIYEECFARAKASGYRQDAKYSTTHAALSCYYSGNVSYGTSVPDVSRYVNEVLNTSVSSSSSVASAIPEDAIPLAAPKPRQVNAAATPSRKPSISMMLE